MKDSNYIPEALPYGPFLDPFELFETDNPALKKVVEAQKTFRNLSEKAFYAALPEIVSIVCKHFGITQKKSRKHPGGQK